jgi:hypothetical protein
MTCAFSAGERLLRLTVENWDTTGGFRVGPEGGDLVASRVFLADTDPPSASEEQVACTGGTPTVANVDRIEATQTQPRADVSAASFLVDLSAGDLAPGPTAEATGISEIEADFDLPGAELGVAGSNGGDRYRLGFTSDELGLNLDGDDDLDIALRGVTFFDLYGRDGSDSIDGRRTRLTHLPRRDIRVFLNGQAGDDRLIAGGKRDQLSGGPGADVLEGGKAAAVLQGDAGPDRLVAAPGSQLLLGGRGDDRIDADNGHRDDIDCGAGNDTAIVDRREGPLGLEGCERVRRAP